MKFEDLQKSWQEQPVTAFTDDTALEQQQTIWQQHQRKLLISNACMSVGFLAAMLGIGWVYVTYHSEFGWPFKVSIASTYLLMIIFLIINWRSYAFKKEDRELSSDAYIQYQITKLNWQKKILLQFTWVYSVLLWLAMVMYIWEITAKGSLAFRFIALSITTAYIAGITLWNMLKKQKKTLLKINSLIEGLQKISSGFQDEQGAL